MPLLPVFDHLVRLGASAQCFLGRLLGPSLGSKPRSCVVGGLSLWLTGRGADQDCDFSSHPCTQHAGIWSLPCLLVFSVRLPLLHCCPEGAVRPTCHSPARRQATEQLSLLASTESGSALH